MRTFPVIIALMLLAGCATTTPSTRFVRMPTDAESAQCRGEAEAKTLSTGVKALVWASNIVVIPATLGFLVVYPKDDVEVRSFAYRACVDRVTMQ